MATVMGEAMAGFAALYDPAAKRQTDLLFAALTNNDPVERCAIAERLHQGG